MTEKEKMALSQLAYLPIPKGKKTLGEFVDYYKDENNLPKNDRDAFKAAVAIISDDKDLMQSTIVGNKHNIFTGFTGYAFQKPSSKDGFVVFRGSDDINDWKNNIAMETKALSAQEIEARLFMTNLKNGAGCLENIDVMGHSLGGYLARLVTFFDDRVASATTYNAPGVSPEFAILHPFATRDKEKLKKINNISNSMDVVSKIGIVHGNKTTISDPESKPLNILYNHSMESIMKGSGVMNSIDLTAAVQSISLEELAELPNALAESTNAFESFRESLSEIFTAVQEKFAEVWGYILLYFTDTIPAEIEKLKEKWNEWSEFWNGVWDNVKAYFSNIWDGILLFFNETIPGAIEALKEKWNSFKDFWGGIWDNVKAFFAGCWDGIVAFAQETLPGIVETIIGYFKDLPGKLWTWLSGAISKIGEWAQGLIAKAQEVLPGAIESIKNFFKALPGNLLEVGNNMIQGIFSGISNGTKWLYDKLRGWKDNVVDYIKGLFHINSPSKLMRDIVGAGIAEGIAVGITENTDLVSDAMRGVEEIVADSDLTITPQISDEGMSFETFREKLRPSLDFIRAQIAYAQESMNLRLAANAELAAAGAYAAAGATYNSGHTFHNSYTITAAGVSPKATADAIKKQMTLQRMLFAN